MEKLQALKLKKAAEKVAESVTETLTYYRFPREHHRQIRSNNMLERVMREIRRRTRVVGSFPDGRSALMLAAARLRYGPSRGPHCSRNCYIFATVPAAQKTGTGLTACPCTTHAIAGRIRTSDLRVMGQTTQISGSPAFSFTQDGADSSQDVDPGLDRSLERAYGDPGAETVFAPRVELYGGNHFGGVGPLRRYGVSTAEDGQGHAVPEQEGA